jgi:hypothetical protein
MANKDILEDRQIREKSGMLVHHGNALPLRFKRGPVFDGGALDDDIADIGPVDSRQQLYARALPGAVLAKQSEDFPARQIERDIAERDRSAESLAHMTQAGGGD